MKNILITIVLLLITVITLTKLINYKGSELTNFENNQELLKTKSLHFQQNFNLKKDSVNIIFIKL